MTKKILSVAVDISGTIYHMIVVYGTLLWNDDVSRGCFLFFKIFILCVVKGEGSGGVKGKKMVQNEKFCLSGSISQESYIIWFWFMVLMCKMIISPVVFFIFSKFWFFGLLGGWKGKKLPKMTKNFTLCTLYFRNHTLYDLDLWCTCVKGSYIQVFFTFFANFNF